MSRLGPYATAADQAVALAARQVSAVELAEAAIARIEARDGPLNAVVVRDFERALETARAADQALARGERRPLLGVPMTVKEAFDVAGLPTTWGLPGTKHIPVTHDAVAVARLKAAGAVILGKTNIAMLLADWQSANPVYGVTNNPWDVSRTPGGSSGGAAAALAAGFTALEVGSDLAGSLRIPAHCCGVYAHKPSHGLVPQRGFAPPGTPWLDVSARLDLAVLGPMARSPADLALALDVIAGPDDDEALAWRLALPPPRRETLAGLRVLVIDEHPMLPTSSAVREAIEGFAGALADAGCRVGRSSPALPDLGSVARLFGQLLTALMSGDTPDAAFDPARAATHRDWIRADRQRAAVGHQWRAFFRDWDILVCPVLPTPAFPHDHRDMAARRIDIDGREVAYTDTSIWASLATLTGQPATAMPIALSDDGLPIAVQAIGPYLEDRTTIAFAALAEHAFGGLKAPPGYG